MILTKQSIQTIEEISLDDYLTHYAEQHFEWVEGRLVALSPIHIKYDEVVVYLRILLQAYFEIKKTGRIVGEPFVLRLPEYPNRRREPDIQVILNDNPNELKETYMDGAPDICIEVVSPESTRRDYGDKFQEYETGKVAEYWLIDPVRQESHFYRLSENERYQSQAIDEAGYYQTLKLPKLKFHIPTLWQAQLPGPSVVVKAIQDMLSGD